MTTATPTHDDADPALAVPAARADGCPFAPPQAYRDAHHEAGPISRVALWDGAPCWLVTGHAQVRSVLGDSRFSADARHPGFPFLSPADANCSTGRRPPSSASTIPSTPANAACSPATSSSSGSRRCARRSSGWWTTRSTR
ncbi:hypothetical protein GCM10025734_23960 [Kitasatospora paranensis]